ncbi:hypothetical protein [Lentzea aerocolonigenes]|uniref:hypothetical protein n=1 Tax=Lentzea aerocolonigenes TaxID=68170 RepID=UPI000AA7EE9A|nr:hypothetical protein [Lentzea aerocolonigenes]
MTGVRRRGYFAAAVAVMGAALFAALFAAPPERPVDIRLVAPPPPPPPFITATATTTVSAVGPVLMPPPPPPPPPPPAKPLPRPKPAPASSAPPSKPRPPTIYDLLRCDSKYFGDADFERCLDWPFDTDELCDFLDEHHLQPIDLRGPDGRKLDDFGLDCD